MNNSFGNIPEEVVNIVKDTCKRFLDVSKYKIFFFGSRVNGKGRDRSDVDLGVLGDEPLPPLVFSNIKESFEEARTVYTIDFVDLKKTSESFSNHVLSHQTLPVF